MKKLNIEAIEKIIKEALPAKEAQELLKPLNEMAMQRRYGLIWEEPDSGAYEEEVAEKELIQNFPFLSELTDRSVLKGNDSATNLLIEGDNLQSLQALQYSHKELVDIIYIDPPYNRGKNDFVYNDRFVDKEDSWRHSSWLSFMNKRLRLAKDLLSEDGVIYISIDDNEHSQLKLLCDQIFGEHNFKGNLPRIVKKGGKTTASIAKNHDYVLIYVKNNHDIFVGLPHYDINFKHKDEHFDTRGPYKLNQTLDYNSLQYSKSMDYPLTLNDKTYYPGGSKKKHEERLNGAHNNYDWTWRWSPDLVEWGLKNDWVVISKTNRIYTKTYLNARIVKDSKGNYTEEDYERTKPLFSVDLVEGKFSNDNGKKDFDRLNLDSDFEFPKPVELIKTLMSLHQNKDAIVLDFFAGSGTTGEAVLNLNQEDSGNRRFILCTNNEVSKDKELNKLIELNHLEPFQGRKGTIAHKKRLAELDSFKETDIYHAFVESNEYKQIGIARAVTYPRVKSVIEGYTTPKGKEEDGISANFRHFVVTLKEDANDLEYNAYKLIEETVDLIRIKEDCFDVVDSLEVEDTPIKRLTSTKKEILVVLDADVFEDEIKTFLDSFIYDDKDHIIYTSYDDHVYNPSVTHKELPEEILQALKLKEMK